MQNYQKPEIIEEIIQFEDIMEASTQFGGSQLGDNIFDWTIL